MDEASVKWSKERYTEILNGLRPFISSCGYDPERDCIFVPISGLSGDNIKEPVSKAVCNWYTGPTMLDIIDNLELPKRDPDGPLRIPVLDKMRDRGVVMFGKVESGTVRLGDQLSLFPSNTLCSVATVYNSKGEPVKYAKCGENIQLRLLNIEDENKINKGDVLCKLNDSIPITDLFEAEVEILELLSYKPILSKGYQCILHIHTVADEATVKDILVAYEKNEKGDVVEKQKPQFTKSFSRIICRIQTRVPIPIEKHDQIPQMGRFTLRDEGKTIAVGKILKYKPVKVVTTFASTSSTQQNNQTQDQTEEVKQSDLAQSQNSTQQPTQRQDLFYDLDSGEMITQEEHIRRQKEREEKDLEDIGEGDEDEGEDEDDNQ